MPPVLQSDFEFPGCLLVMYSYPIVTMQIRYLFDPSVLQASHGPWETLKSDICTFGGGNKQTFDALFICFLFITENLYGCYVAAALLRRDWTSWNHFNWEVAFLAHIVLDKQIFYSSILYAEALLVHISIMWVLLIQLLEKHNMLNKWYLLWQLNLL